MISKWFAPLTSISSEACLTLALRAAAKSRDWRLNSGPRRRRRDRDGARDAVEMPLRGERVLLVFADLHIGAARAEQHGMEIEHPAHRHSAPARASCTARIANKGQRLFSVRI